MTIEAQLAQLQQAVTEQTDASVKLATDVTDSINEIDQVKVDMHSTHDLIKANHQAINDWQTKTGKVSLKDLNGQSYQVDSLSDLINDTQKINPHPDVMTKAQFDALRQMRKQQYAGSGFVEWGKAGGAFADVINEGLWVHKSRPEIMTSLQVGRTLDGKGISNENMPLVNVDGVLHSISAPINIAPADYAFPIRFPEAPDGTKTYDSATGKVTQHASAAEAFNECRHKAPDAVYAGIYNNELGEFTFQQTGVGGLYFVNKANTGSHKVHIVFTSSVDTNIEFRDATGAIGADPLIKSFQASANIKHTVTFNHTFRNGGVYLRAPEAQVDQKITIHSWQTLPATEQVITSRKDLVFLESWHEQIADKDVVYPLGNVQFGASTYEGIGLANNLVAQGYSAFGEWDTDTKGYGVKWSTLSAANRVKFLKNPEHNIYYDPEAKAYIQVRYRVRVVEGVGDGHRSFVSNKADTRGFGGRYDNANTRYQVPPQGASLISPKNYMNYSEQGNYLPYRYHAQMSIDPQLGLYAASKDGSEGSRTDFAYHGLCFAIPIALVQRLNQGAYHPSYNPMGCNGFAHIGNLNTYAAYWHGEHIARSPYCTLDCFVPYAQGGARTNSNEFGHISGTGKWSGRTDQYKNYDAIYAGQVEDLRINANKLDVNQLRERVMQKAVTGKLRGKEKVPFTLVNTGLCKDSGMTIYVGWAANYENPLTNHQHLYGLEDYLSQPDHTKFDGPLVWIKFLDFGDTNASTFAGGHALNSWVAVSRFQVLNSQNSIALINPNTANNDWFNEGRAQTIKAQIIMPTEMQGGEFDSLPWVDIVGSPDSITAAFPSGVIGQLIPKSLTEENRTLDLNRKANATPSVLYTTDNGAIWESRAQEFNTVANTLTLDTTIYQPESVIMISYESSANLTVPANNTALKSTVNSIWASADRFITQGNRLISSLSGVIGKDNQNGNQQRDLAVLNAPKYSNGYLWDSNKVSHSPVTLREPLNQSGGVKALPSIVEKNGLLYMQFNGAELKWDNTEFITINSANVNDDFYAGNLYWVHPEVGGALAGKYLRCVKFGNEPFGSLSWAHTQNGYSYRTIPNNIYFVDAPWGASAWGDDQTIPIINGENTKTDLNGNTVKVFCHHTQLPLGIASH